MTAPVEHRIRWYVYAGGNGSPLVKMRHKATMRGHWPGWDVECSCGWQTLTGGATRSYIRAEVELHKILVGVKGWRI